MPACQRVVARTTTPKILYYDIMMFFPALSLSLFLSSLLRLLSGPPRVWLFDSRHQAIPEESPLVSMLHNIQIHILTAAEQKHQGLPAEITAAIGDNNVEVLIADQKSFRVCCAASCAAPFPSPRE